MAKTKPLEFRLKDFCIPVAGIVTASERNPVETREYSPKMYLQSILFCTYHVAYSSVVLYSAMAGIETLLK
jgi:hypothetical protein